MRILLNCSAVYFITLYVMKSKSKFQKGISKIQNTHRQTSWSGWFPRCNKNEMLKANDKDISPQNNNISSLKSTTCRFLMISGAIEFTWFTWIRLMQEAKFRETLLSSPTAFWKNLTHEHLQIANGTSNCSQCLYFREKYWYYAAWVLML